ncbi:MAG: methylated-DNA--[protein]-cysteine S-methyltransferase [Prevotella sp.]|nr:methylated-DNA--[protein]-cysteine S-methyltransferase [Staphylococcus sp.]MCM1349856.1 methylated-DNA--[protein]-cysteine S-methyltransferase [Prevotella sp.]
MHYTTKYQSPLGEIMLASDDIGLIGLWFVDQKYFALHLDKDNIEKETPLLQDAKKWLDSYFSGREPDFKLPLHFVGTDFQKEVWEILYSIPYGKTITYGDIASILAKRRGLKRMSAQAVGGAVGHNPISILVPCHRVVGTNGSLTGYAGGIKRKVYLLEHEKVNIDQFFIPAKGTAL